MSLVEITIPPALPSFLGTLRLWYDDEFPFCARVLKLKISARLTLSSVSWADPGLSSGGGASLRNTSAEDRTRATISSLGQRSRNKSCKLMPKSVKNKEKELILRFVHIFFIMLFFMFKLIAVSLIFLFNLAVDRY